MNSTPRTALTISLFMAMAILAPIQARAGTVYRLDLSAHPDGPADLPGVVCNEGRFRIDQHSLSVESDQSNPRVGLPVQLDADGTFRATVRDAALCDRVMIEGWSVYMLEVNRQYGQMVLLRQTDKTFRPVATAAGYLDYARWRDHFELRLVRSGRKVAGFIDDHKLVEFDDPANVPPGGRFALLGGWGTHVAWRDISVSDQPDLRDSPREVLPTAAPEDLVRVTRVRGLNSDNIYFDGQSAGFVVTVVSARRAKLSLTYRLLDVRQKVIGKPVVLAVDLSDGKERQLQVRFPPTPRGCFKIAMYVEAASGQPKPATAPDAALWVEDVGCFTVVSKAIGERAANPDSVFGGHIDGVHLDWHATAARKLGVQWVRCHDMLQYTWWTQIQPDERSKWTWRDDSQQTLDKHQYSTLGEFLWTPRWASTQPARPDYSAFPPREMDDFANYVTATVGHYHGSIHAWEVWNEPQVRSFWAGSPADYARLLEAAYPAAKKADPNCVVLGGGGVSLESMHWVEQFIASLHGKPMDAFSIHYLWPETATGDLQHLRKLLAAHGIDVPIWNTESSVITTSFLDQHRRTTALPEARFHYRNACDELVRMYMENIANGVKHVFYYELADPWRFGPFPKPRPPKREIGTSMWDEGQMLKPIAAAHAALADVIEGKTFVKRLTAGPIQVFIFASPQEAAAVCYAEFDSFERQERLPLALPAGLDPANLTVLDFMDNELPGVVRDNSFMLTVSREPVYFRLRGSEGAAKLETLLAGLRLQK